MRKVVALSLALTAVACETDGGTPAPKAQEPEVTGSTHDTSPPLREIPPAKPEDGHRVHPVKPVPRPSPDGGPNGKDP
jgi:hypothetical protein